MDVPNLVSNAAKRFPERTAVIEGERSLTFGELRHRAGRAATAFRAAGLERGDRVALLALNELEYLEILVATQLAGLIVVPLNFRLAVRELAFMVHDSTPSLLIHGPGFESQAAELGLEQTWHLGPNGMGAAYDEKLDAAGIELFPSALAHEDAAAILYTSGTTGSPKGAVISNGALWARCNMFGLEVGMTPGDVFIQALPMFHMAANMSQAFAYVGATNVMVKAFDPPLMAAEMSRHRATHVMLVPTMINLLCEDASLARTDLSALRMVLYGASPIPPEVLRRAIAALRCDFLQFFGMTETAGSSLLRPADHDPNAHPAWLGSAGTDSLSFETRIVDSEDRDVPVGVVGEIVSRGPSVMDGYWNAPEATAAALRGGWMHTGDLGYRSEEGYLYITDRLKDMIVSGGENVYPREVEDVLYEHPAVLEAAVIGVPHERWGEAVHAVVVPRAGVDLDLDALTAHCRVHLAGYKVPKSMEIAMELPKNTTGKILKRVMRESYWEGHERRVR